VRRIFEENITSRNLNQNNATLWRFFHQIKVCQPIGTRNSIQIVCPRSRRLEAPLYLAAQNFEFFSNTRSKLINLKPIAVDG
jgi:hypothetical protein